MCATIKVKNNVRKVCEGVFKIFDSAKTRCSQVSVYKERKSVRRVYKYENKACRNAKRARRSDTTCKKEDTMWTKWFKNSKRNVIWKSAKNTVNIFLKQWDKKTKVSKRWKLFLKHKRGEHKKQMVVNNHRISKGPIFFNFRKITKRKMAWEEKKKRFTKKTLSNTSLSWNRLLCLVLFLVSSFSSLSDVLLRDPGSGTVNTDHSPGTMWVWCAHSSNTFRTQNVWDARVMKMRCTAHESDVLCNVLTLGSMVKERTIKNMTLTWNFFDSQERDELKTVYSVLRCSQTKSLGDVTETQESTEHILLRTPWRKTDAHSVLISFPSATPR